MKKILALVLALTLCLGLSVTALAEVNPSEPTTTPAEYSIKIDNAVAGQTYNAYKIFDAKVSTVNGKETVVYTINRDSDWFNVVAGYRAQGESNPVESAASPVDTGYVVLTQINGTTTWSVTLSEGVDDTSSEAAAAFAKYLAANIGDIAADGTGSTDRVQGATDNVVEVTINLSEAGYYFVDTSLGALTSLNTVTGPEQDIKEKNSQPTIDKKVQEDSTGEFGDTNTADIGDVVNFKSTITLGANAAARIKLHDNMTAGLTFDASSVKVYIVGEDGAETLLENPAEGTPCYSVITSGLSDECTFEVAFDDEYIASFVEGLSADATKEIVVKYSAELNANAVVGDGTDGADGKNKNTTKLTYGNENKFESVPSETITYTYEFNVFKYYSVGEGAEKTEKPLAGAGFKLYKEVGDAKTKNYAKFNQESGKFEGWTTNIEEATELTSTTDKKILISGLDADTYYLEETTTPEGYNSLTAPIEIVISESTETDLNGKVNYDSGKTAENDATDNSVVNVVKVENKSGTLLPSTGGIGTTIFYVVGGILMLGAVILLITKKKMGSKQ